MYMYCFLFDFFVYAYIIYHITVLLGPEPFIVQTSPEGGG